MDTGLAGSWVRAVADALTVQRDLLTKLDSAIGDGDHGINMDRGFATVVRELAQAEPESVGAVFTGAGSVLVSSVGGASGPLYGAAFRAVGRALPGSRAGTREFAAALESGLAAVQKLGAAEPGDKTIVDAYAPALAAFRRAADEGAAFRDAAVAAAEAAEEGMRATVPLQARKGRASYLGPRSIGHQDPGATSTALIFRALADVTAAG